MYVLANAIGDDGTAYGQAGSRPIFWLADGAGQQPWGRLEAGSFIAANDVGQALRHDGQGHVLVWSQASGFQVPPTPAGTRYVQGFELNDAGLAGVVGRIGSDAAGILRPMLLKADTAPVVLPVGFPESAPFEERRIDGLSQAGAVISRAPRHDLPGSPRRPFHWDPVNGFRDLLGTAGDEGQALGISRDGAVVGWYRSGQQPEKAYGWSEADGFVDLNQRLAAGTDIVIDRAVQVADSGHIVALAGGRVVLLSPGDGSPGGGDPGDPGDPGPGAATPVVESITAPTRTRRKAMARFNASFTDPQAGAGQYTATWDWGDGSAPQAVTARYDANGGQVRGNHAFDRIGVYEVTLTVTDEAGHAGRSSHVIQVMR